MSADLMPCRSEMPIMGSKRIKSIPWGVIDGHERQAQSNHYQTLERLAERGGLAPAEAVAIIEDRKFHNMDNTMAEDRLIEACEAWNPRTAPSSADSVAGGGVELPKGLLDFIYSADLYAVLMDAQHATNAPATTWMANKAITKLDNLKEAMRGHLDREVKSAKIDLDPLDGIDAIATAPVSVAEGELPFGYMIREKTAEAHDEFLYRQAWDHMSPAMRAKFVIKTELFTAPQPDRARFAGESIDTTEFRDLLFRFAHEPVPVGEIVAYVHTWAARRTGSRAVGDGWQMVPKMPNEKMRGILQWFDRGSPAQIDEGWEKVLAAARRAGSAAVMDGWKLVPVEPTRDMLAAGVKGFQKAGYNDDDKLHDWAACYRAMLGASPRPTSA